MVCLQNKTCFECKYWENGYQHYDEQLVMLINPLMLLENVLNIEKWLPIKDPYDHSFTLYAFT